MILSSANLRNGIRGNHCGGHRTRIYQVAVAERDERTPEGWGFSFAFKKKTVGFGVLGPSYRRFCYCMPWGTRWCMESGADGNWMDILLNWFNYVHRPRILLIVIGLSGRLVFFERMMFEKYKILKGSQRSLFWDKSGVLYLKVGILSSLDDFSFDFFCF